VDRELADGGYRVEDMSIKSTGDERWSRLGGAVGPDPWSLVGDDRGYSGRLRPQTVESGPTAAVVTTCAG
jgi:hypothetical protein